MSIWDPRGEKEIISSVPWMPTDTRIAENKVIKYIKYVTPSTTELKPYIKIVICHHLGFIMKSAKIIIINNYKYIIILFIDNGDNKSLILFYVRIPPVFH